MVFADREDAGRRLAARLGHLRGEAVVVLGLPRGGVPVAFQVAQALGAPLDVVIVRKLGVPSQPELAMGAVGEGGVRIINHQIVREAQVAQDELNAVQARSRPPWKPAPRATGPRGRASPWTGGWRWSSMTASPPGPRPVLPARSPGRTGPRGSCSPCPSRRPAGRKNRQGRRRTGLRRTPSGFFAIGEFYARFPQVPDDEVIACLRGAAPAQVTAQSTGAPRRG